MRADYVEAKRLGDREYRRATAEGRYPYLPSLDEILEKDGKLAEVPVGLTEIPLHMVVGTKTRGRQQAFADNFMPIMLEVSEFAFKWADLYDAHITEGIRDPILCYEYMKRFYVQEGNKRVSVMKFAEAPYISANVTRILPRRIDEKAVRIYYEFVDFYKVAPIYEIDFSEEGCYQRFAELIGQNLTDPWPADVLLDVKAAYAEFSKLFRKAGGDKLDITTGDAFLFYITIYPLESLLNDSESQNEERLEQIWNEFLTEDNDKGIRLIDSPNQIEKTRTIFDIFTAMPHYTREQPLRAAFIYSKTAATSSWNYGHELGRQYVQDKFGGIVDTIMFENCANDAAVKKAIDAAAADGDQVVFTTSPVQMEETLRGAIYHPEIKFLNCSLNLAHNAVRTYYGKMFEPKFILGALAAMVATNHKIGYLADYPIYGVVANINAFAQGAALIDPRATIHLKWSTKKGTAWKADFQKEGVYVISGPDFIKPAAPSHEYGVYLIDQMENGAIYNLGAPVWNWGRYYELILRSILDGSWDSNNVVTNDTALNYWFGFKSGVVDVILSDKLSYQSRKLVQILKQGIIEGRVAPFAGELHSQTGLIQPEGSPKLSGQEVITMSWLADNVVGEIPEKYELNEEARDAATVSGVTADLKVRE